MSTNGSNPIRWDCEKNGCFNKKSRPKIELFCDCFPGKINFGDIDAVVEINHRLLIQEWKNSKVGLCEGQRLMYKRLSMQGHVILIIRGNAETMEVEEFGIWIAGKWSEWRSATLENLKDICLMWTQIVKTLAPPALDVHSHKFVVLEGICPEKTESNG